MQKQTVLYTERGSRGDTGVHYMTKTHSHSYENVFLWLKNNTKIAIFLPTLENVQNRGLKRRVFQRCLFILMYFYEQDIY